MSEDKAHATGKLALRAPVKIAASAGSAEMT
jgi:hypothetical protein